MFFDLKFKTQNLKFFLIFMPIYEYCCKECGCQFEQLQKITDNVLVTCPKCGQKGLQKMISQTSFQLKGTGWYVTDFKNKPTKNSEKTSETPKKTEEKISEAPKKEEPKDKKPDIKETKTGDKK